MAPTKAAAKKGKKKGAKKKGAKGKEGEGEEPLTAEEKTVFLLRQLESNRLHLVRETERAAAASRAECELRERMVQLEADCKSERERTHSMAADMTRQYKGMREELMGKVHALQDEIVQYQDRLEGERMRTAEVERVKDQEIALKDAKIAELTAAMDDMAAEFQEMLKQTLDKMSQKIVISNEWGPGADGGKDQPVVTTFEHFDLGLGSK